MTNSLKDRLFNEVLPALGKDAAYFSFARIKAAVAAKKLGLADATLKVYLNEALRKGVVGDAGRGWYSRLSESLAFDPRPLRKLIRATTKALPLLDFCAWSTVQLNPWMHHLLAQPVHFLYVPRETLDDVGDTLRAQGWEVAVNPGISEASKAVVPGEKMVVLRPAHSKQPRPQDHQAAPEQVLVDLLVETEALGLMDTSEAKAVFVGATNSGLVNISEMKRFAEFRKLKWEKIWIIN